jgi:predicted ATPase/DNA-binding winged helix-turn-helix (wHTH) protein
VHPQQANPQKKLRCGVSPAGPAAALEERTIRFGPFQFVRSQRLLLRSGQQVRLGNRALDLLSILTARAGSVIPKEELIAHAWPHTIVEEISLRVHIAALRRALGDGQTGNRYILNIVGRGYSFVAPVQLERLLEVQNVEPPPAPRKPDLPALLTRVVGRESEVSALTQTVRTRRLVTIVGPGGMGKTTLALAIAHGLCDSFDDAAHFLDMAAINDPTLISNALAAALSVNVAAQNPLPDLMAFLRDRNVLLVLDNCEHVLTAVATLVEYILKGARGVHILATSREPLSAEGEWQHRLPALSVPRTVAGITAEEAIKFDAVALFVERVTCGSSDFELSKANAPVVSDICRRLDGNPLAIELAAARVNLLGVQELAARLEEQFFIITNSRRRSVPRHQTLRATLDWSYALLTPTEHTVFERLSLFNSYFTPEGAAMLAARGGLSAGAVYGAVMSLAAKSLLATEHSGTTVRHRLLYTTRVYAFEKLTKSADFADAFQWHADYVARQLQRAAVDWETLARPQWTAQYESTMEDLRSALDWAFSAHGEKVLGADLTAASVAFGEHLGVPDEFCDLIEHALTWLEAFQVRQHALETQLRVALAGLKSSGESAERGWAIAHAGESSDMTGIARYKICPMLHKSIHHIENGQYGAALENARNLANGVSRIADPLATLVSDKLMAQALHFFGDHAAARRVAERVLSSTSTTVPIAYGSTHVDIRVTMRVVIARALWLGGRPERALETVNECLEYATADGPFALCQALAIAACPIALWHGDHSEAHRLVTLLLEQAARYRLHHWQSYGRFYAQATMASEADGCGNLPDLIELQQKGTSKRLILDTLATIDWRLVESAITRSNLDGAEGWCAPELVRIEGERLLIAQTADAARMAERAFARSMELARTQGALAWRLRGAMSLARLWSAQGDPRRAREVLSATLGLFEEGRGTRDVQQALALLDALR